MSSPEREAPARTLADQLRRWPDERLAALLRVRSDLATPPPQDSAQLASRAATRSSIQLALDKLTRLELCVLDALIVAGQTTSARAISLVHADPRAAAQALDRLLDLALVWESAGELRALSSAAEALAIRPGASGVRPFSPEPRDPDAVAAAVAGLSPAARAMLEHVDTHGGEATTGRARRTVSPADAETPAEELIARRLLVPRDNGTLVLPGEVGTWLRGGHTTREPVGEPPVLATSQVELAAVDRAAGGAAFDAVRRVELLLDRWGVTPPPVLRSGGLGVRELRAAANELHVDEPTAALLVEVAAEAGLVAESADADGNPAWMPTDSFDVWTTRSPAERWAMLATAWRSTDRVASLVGSRPTSDGGGASKAWNALSPELASLDAAPARDLALSVLASMPAGEALAAGTGTASVVARATWLRPRRAPIHSSLVVAALDEAAVLGVTGRGALGSAGRLLADGESGGAVAAMEPRLPSPVDHVLLQADLTAVAPGPLETELARKLHLLADVESRGGATVYRFGRDSTRRAFDAGWSAVEVHDFIGSISRTPVPQPLSYLVDDVARTFGAVRAGHAESFLRADDEALLASLVHDPRTASLGLRLVAPTVVISTAPLDVLLPRLREIGAAPVVEAPDGTVHVARPDLKRARRRGARRAAGQLAGRQEAQVQAAVSGVRAGDRARASRPATSAGPTSPGDALATLREAIESRTSMVIAYVDNDGRARDRTLVPQRLAGGRLTAVDHRTESTVQIAVHRITSVTPVTA